MVTEGATEYARPLLTGPTPWSMLAEVPLTKKGVRVVLEPCVRSGRAALKAVMPTEDPTTTVVVAVAVVPAALETVRV